MVCVQGSDVARAWTHRCCPRVKIVRRAKCSVPRPHQAECCSQRDRALRTDTTHPSEIPSFGRGKHREVVLPRPLGSRREKPNVTVQGLDAQRRLCLTKRKAPWTDGWGQEVQDSFRDFRGYFHPPNPAWPHSLTEESVVYL